MSWISEKSKSSQFDDLQYSSRCFPWVYLLHQETVVTDAVLGGTAGRAAASMIALLTMFGPCSQFVVLHELAGAVSATANKTEDVFPRYPETATSCSAGRSLILSSFGRGVVFSRFG